MRGDDRQPAHLFSYISAESRVPADHPLRAVRLLVDGLLQQMAPVDSARAPAAGTAAPAVLLRPE